jgi:DUF4097 and DUF4098 domain-containing protein YvlB
MRIFIAPCLILSATVCASPAEADDYVKSYSIAQRADVRVHADEGSVRVITTDTNQVEFRVQSTGFAAVQLGGQFHVDSQQSGDVVELNIKTSRGVTVGINTKSIKTEIRMPRDADLLLETHDGAVEVSALKGNIRVHTGDGSVKASRLSGHIDLITGDGGVTADTLAGDMQLRTGDGGIDAVSLDGNLAATSKDGAVRVAGRFDFLDIKSGDGRVQASVARGSKMSSPWNVRTKDGSVELTLPTELQANLDARTRDGHISSKLPVTVAGELSKSHIEGTMNGGGPLLSVRTGDGSIRLDSL